MQSHLSERANGEKFLSKYGHLSTYGQPSGNDFACKVISAGAGVFRRDAEDSA
jgi:hypothetical protein